MSQLKQVREKLQRALGRRVTKKEALEFIKDMKRDKIKRL